MTIQQFIEKAIEGGWKFKNVDTIHIIPQDRITSVRDSIRILAKFNDGYQMYVSEEEILLDPLAWKAVGKVEGWAEFLCGVCRTGFTSDHILHHSGVQSTPEWKYNFINLACELAEGKTIEQFIETL